MADEENVVQVEQTDFVLFQNVRMKLEKIERELAAHSWHKSIAKRPGIGKVGKRSRDGPFASTEPSPNHEAEEVKHHPAHLQTALIAIGEDLKKVDEWIAAMRSPEAQDVLIQRYVTVEEKFFKAWGDYEKIAMGSAE